MSTVSVIKVPTRLIEKNGKTVEESNYYELAELDNSESLHYGLGAVDSGITTQVNFILQHMMKWEWVKMLNSRKRKSRMSRVGQQRTMWGKLFKEAIYWMVQKLSIQNELWKSKAAVNFLVDSTHKY